MRIIDLVIIFISHGLALVPFVTSMLNGRRPAISDFAVLSFILYYDVGILLEMFGFPYYSDYFFPFLGANDGIFLLGVFFIISGPWLLHAGSSLVNRDGHRLPQEPVTQLEPNRRRYFYGLLALVVLPLAAYGLLLTLAGNPIWLTRLTIASTWGPFIVVLYLPLHFLAFYVSQRDSRTWRGTLVSLALVPAAVLATIVIGERTIVLLPFLVLALFRLRMTVTRLVIATVILVAAAGILLSIFKFNYSQTDLGASDLVSQTLSNDIARAPVLRTVLEQSQPIGTQMLPYPMAGYVYSALFFMPRSLVPFKGVSTAHFYTGYVAGTDPEETDWGLGIGMIEELMLNGGVLLVLPGLLVYGVAMGFLDRLSFRVSTLVVPTRLAALWLCGYDFPAVLLTFGMMALVGVALQLVFVRGGLAGESTRVGATKPQESAFSPKLTPNPLGGTTASLLGSDRHGPQ
jgi:hypothetical protein